LQQQAVAVIYATYAVATATAFFTSGRVEEPVYFRCFGGEAAKTTEKDRHFLAAAGRQRRLRREQPRRLRKS
jgi:hypothetical protein